LITTIYNVIEELYTVIVLLVKTITVAMDIYKRNNSSERLSGNLFMLEFKYFEKKRFHVLTNILVSFIVGWKTGVPAENHRPGACH
jgi:hypothetical protein